MLLGSPRAQLLLPPPDVLKYYFTQTTQSSSAVPCTSCRRRCTAETTAAGLACRSQYRYTSVDSVSDRFQKQFYKDIILNIFQMYYYYFTNKVNTVM